jgi:hypothetical protein
MQSALDGSGERPLTYLNATLWSGLDLAAVERLQAPSKCVGPLRAHSGSRWRLGLIWTSITSGS